MFGRILHRMIFGELTKVFLMSLVGITGILLLAGIVAEASQQGLGPTQILAAIPLLIPSTLPYTIPATTLFAASVVYGRLAADNEILAIKAAGINVLQVVKPGLLLGILASGVTMGLYYTIIPYSHHLLRTMVLKDTEELLYSMLRRQRVIAHSQMPYAMWVRGVEGRKLINPTFKRRNQATNVIDVVAQAREADLRVDMGKEPPVLLVHMRWGVAVCEDGSKAYFEDKVWEVPLPKMVTNQRRPRDMTWEELMEERRSMKEKLVDLEDEISSKTARVGKKGEPADLPMDIFNLKERRKHFEGLLRQLEVELLMRPALERGLSVFHPGRLPGGHVVQPERLPQLVHHLFLADRDVLLPADPVRHTDGQGGPGGPDGPAGLVGRHPDRLGGCCPVLAVAAQLTTRNVTRPREPQNGVSAARTVRAWAQAAVDRSAPSSTSSRTIRTASVPTASRQARSARKEPEPARITVSSGPGSRARTVRMASASKLV